MTTTITAQQKQPWQRLQEKVAYSSLAHLGGKEVVIGQVEVKAGEANTTSLNHLAHQVHTAPVIKIHLQFGQLASEKGLLII